MQVEEARQLKIRLEGRERQLEEHLNQLQQALQQQEHEFAARLAEQAERRRKDEERIRQELETAKRVLEEQRQRLEKEHKEQQAAFVREREELEKERCELESQIAQKRRDIEIAAKESGDGDAIRRTELEQEFLCVICHSVMISAITLECSHSFCQGCIDSWMVQKQVIHDLLRCFVSGYVTECTFRCAPCADIPSIGPQCGR